MKKMHESARALAIYLWTVNKYQNLETGCRLKSSSGDDLELFWSHCRRGAALPDYRTAVALGAEAEFRYAHLGTRLLCPGDDEYPLTLEKFHRCPLVLAVQGDVSVLGMPQISIVGSRDTMDEARAVTECIADAVMERGFCVTSGGAIGIDALAHRRAMSRRVPTVVVTAGGICHDGPKQNGDIFDYARSEGVLVSQFPNEFEPIKRNFPVRNSVIAGLSEATVVVHCRESSGAIYTAEAARRMGRPVFVAAMRGFHPLSSGGLRLVRDGQARLLYNEEDLDILGAVPSVQRNIHFDGDDIRSSALPPELMGDTQIGIAQILSDGPAVRENMRQKLSFPDDFDESILEMELAGIIDSVGGVYRLSR